MDHGVCLVCGVNGDNGGATRYGCPLLVMENVLPDVAACC